MESFDPFQIAFTKRGMYFKGSGNRRLLFAPQSTDFAPHEAARHESRSLAQPSVFAEADRIRFSETKAGAIVIHNL